MNMILRNAQTAERKNTAVDNLVGGYRIPRRATPASLPAGWGVEQPATPPPGQRIIQSHWALSGRTDSDFPLCIEVIDQTSPEPPPPHWSANPAMLTLVMAIIDTWASTGLPVPANWASALSTLESAAAGLDTAAALQLTQTALKLLSLRAELIEMGGKWDYVLETVNQPPTDTK